MSEANFSCQVASSFEGLWKTLLDEGENPHRYNPGILDCEILERFNDGLLRLVKVPDGEVREKVIFDYNKKMIKSSLVGHPSLVGVVAKKISGDEKAWTINSTVEWDSIDDRVDGMIRRNMESFITTSMEAVKKKAEAS